MNNFSISSAGIGEALTRSSSALAAANNTLAESIALVVAGNETLQDPEKVGNAVRSISMRIRGMKTELEEAGDSTEGMAETTSKLQEKIKALAGVDIMKSANEFKSTTQILKELGSVWNDISDTDQAAVLELIAGKNNSVTAASILSNYEQIDNVLKTIEEDSGSAMRENTKYLDSISGRLSVFNAEFQSLSTNILNSDLIKGAVNAGTGLLGFLNQVIEKFGSLSTLVAAGGVGLALSGNGMKYALPYSMSTVA